MKKSIFRGLVLFVVSLVFSCTSLNREPPPQLDPPSDFPTWAWEGGIYELSIRNFTPEGTFKAAEAQLDRVKALGIKTLWIMPLYPIGQIEKKGALGSPYSISDYQGVNPDFGTLEDFRSLVKTAHGKGLKVIIDLVANHTAWDHPWVKAHPTWYTQDKNGKIVPPVADWADVADLNYNNPDLRKEMTNIMVWWVKEMDIDGYRADTGAMLPLDFWEESLPTVKAVKDVLLLAESDEPNLITAGFHMNYAWPGYSALKKSWSGEAAVFDYAQTALGEWMNTGGAPLLRFITNHDETSWDNPPPVIFGGLSGSQAAAVATFLMPGIPLIYQGQELGLDVKEDLFGKHTYDWTQGLATQEFYRNLLSLWKNNKAFQSGALDLQLSTNESVLSFAREAEGKRFIVLVNFTPDEQALGLPEVWKGRSYTQVSTGEPWDAQEITLPGYGWLILEGTY